MRYKLFNNKANRTNRLAQKIGKRLDRENPKRKMHKMVGSVLAVVVLLLAIVGEHSDSIELVVLFTPFVLFAGEVFRLKNRSPRRLWREVMLIALVGTIIFAVFPFAMWMDDVDPVRFKTFLIIYAVLALIMFVLFIYAWMRMRRIKREIAEEKEQLWRRYERQKRLEKLNAL